MSDRKTPDADIQGVLRGFSQEPSLRRETKSWSTADFDYALHRVDIDTPQILDREQFAQLLSRLRGEREIDERSRSESEESERRHQEALAESRSANHIAKWAIVIAVIALIVAVVQGFWR